MWVTPSQSVPGFLCGLSAALLGRSSYVHTRLAEEQPYSCLQQLWLLLSIRCLQGIIVLRRPHTFAWFSLPFGSMAPLSSFPPYPGKNLSSPLQTISFCKNKPTFPLASKFSVSLNAFPSCLPFQILPVFQGQVQGTSTCSTCELEAFFQLEAWKFLWKATCMALVSSSLKMCSLLYHLGCQSLIQYTASVPESGLLTGFICLFV